MRAAIITISTSLSEGRGVDESGPALADWARSIGAEVSATEIVPDEQPKIEWALRHYADSAECALVLTTGGTGFAPSDVTPEATRAVIERDAPGFAETLRAESLRHTPLGILTRGLSGIAGRTLIVNFPGNPKAIDQLFPVLAPTLRHVHETLNR
jgi:molybdopterin adenylyltransferase